MVELINHDNSHRLMSQCRPILWLPMALPIGVSTGFVSVSLANALARGGVAESATGDVVATFFLALAFGVLWGPAIDTCLSRRLWVGLGVTLTAAGLISMTLLPSTAAVTPVLGALAFATGTGAIIVGLASKGIAAYVLSMDQRALAGAWYAAGNLGASSAGGALGVWLFASEASRPLIAVIVASSVLVTLVAVAWLPREPYQSTSGISRRLAIAFSDTWKMLRGAKGRVALALCVLPFGTGAAIILMPSAAPLWNAGPGVVSTASAVSAPVSAVAALMGGWLAVRLRPWRAFMLLGIALIAVALFALPLPHTAAYLFGTYNVYAFVQGAIWTAFYAVVFDTAGQGAASTKMGVFLSLSNLPYWYVALIEGRAVDRWGISGLLLSDGLLALAGLIVIIVLAKSVSMNIWNRAADSGVAVMTEP